MMKDLKITERSLSLTGLINGTVLVIVVILLVVKPAGAMVI
ncbi:hypothetical protein [Parachryseolinea silvisoli]|jgi:hypothetical protein|nr:hypothetical protein [Parachryseolinea silvisoli]